jgi:hypothetical protein
MGQLQNEMKPLGMKMTTGKTVRLDEGNQVKIAAWAAMVATTSEYDHYPEIVIAKEDKNFLRDNSIPSNRFRIWLGRVPASTWEPGWIRHPFAILDREEPAVDEPPDDSLLNTLLTTHRLGEMFVHVMYCCHEGILHDWSFPWQVATRLTQIWPIRNRKEYWPPLYPLTPDLATQASGAFLDYSKYCRRISRVAHGLDPN